MSGAAAVRVTGTQQLLWMIIAVLQFLLLAYRQHI